MDPNSELSLTHHRSLSYEFKIYPAPGIRNHLLMSKKHGIYAITSCFFKGVGMSQIHSLL